MTTTRSRNGSSGCRIGVNVKPEPLSGGVKRLMITPLGTYTKPSRRTGRAAARAAALRAGTMASRNGRAMAAPAPRRNVRRGNDRAVLIMALGLLAAVRGLSSGPPRIRRAGASRKRKLPGARQGAPAAAVGDAAGAERRMRNGTLSTMPSMREEKE